MINNSAKLIKLFPALFLFNVDFSRVCFYKQADSRVLITLEFVTFPPNLEIGFVDRSLSFLILWFVDFLKSASDSFTILQIYLNYFKVLSLLHKINLRK